MLAATVLGTLLAIGLVRSRARWAPGANVLMLVPLVVPEIVAGISALLIFSQLGIRLSFWTIVIAHITFSISYVTIVVRARMAAISEEVEQAAMDLGATRWQAVRLTLVPALWPSILAAGLLVFAFSFDDFVLSFFTTGEDLQPLPVRIWSAIRFGLDPTINAIGTLMMVVSLSAIGLAIALPRLFGKRESGIKVLTAERDNDDRGDPARERDQAIRRLHRGGRRRPGDRGGRILLAARPVRLRQDDDAADARGLRGADRGADHARGRAGRERAALRAERQPWCSRAMRFSTTSTSPTTLPSASSARRSPRTRSRRGSVRRWSWSASPSAPAARSEELSGGQRQRVALARALVNRPAVLLLDEPLGALDLKLRRQMQVELKQIQREVGITFVFVTHDQEEALSISDRIAVMNHGKVAQSGAPEEVYERPTEEFVAGFIGISNLLEGTVEESGNVRLGTGFTVPAPFPTTVGRATWSLSPSARRRSRSSSSSRTWWRSRARSRRASISA